MAAAEWSYRHPRTGEWAHDVRDPLAEARRTFVAPAWEARPPHAGRPLRILEVGFGRGLNTAAALERLAAEAAPGPVEALGFEPQLDRLPPAEAPPGLSAFAPWWGRAAGAWESPGPPPARGTVAAERAAAGLRRRRPAPFDWIFLDLFSPARHPEDWESGLLPALTSAAAPGAVLTSYCVARSLRDGLAALGWQVERLRPAGRRAGLRALRDL